MGNKLKKSATVPMVRITVFVEPRLRDAFSAQSIKRGSKYRCGSASEYLRRAGKTLLINDDPKLLNVKDIGWSEAYEV